MYATNVFGPINLIKKLIPVWKKSGTGHAITISSIVGIMGFPFSSVYSSSKFAVEGFMEAILLELHGYPNIKYALKPFFTHSLSFNYYFIQFSLLGILSLSDFDWEEKQW